MGETEEYVSNWLREREDKFERRKRERGRERVDKT